MLSFLAPLKVRDLWGFGREKSEKVRAASFSTPLFLPLAVADWVRFLLTPLITPSDRADLQNVDRRRATQEESRRASGCPWRSDGEAAVRRVSRDRFEGAPVESDEEEC